MKFKFLLFSAIICSVTLQAQISFVDNSLNPDPDVNDIINITGSVAGNQLRTFIIANSSAGTVTENNITLMPI